MSIISSFKKNVTQSQPKQQYTYTPGDSINDAITNIPHNIIEPFVIQHFNEILDNSSSNEYVFFTLYDSWRKLFVKNYRFILVLSTDLTNYKIISEHFPEVANDVYDYLFRECIIRKSTRLSNEIDIATDLLQTMAYFERYYECSFPEVRKYVNEILEATQYYAEFYNTIQILENDFDIPMSIMEPTIKTTIHSEIQAWISKEDRTSHDCENTLTDFFANSYAYDYFMTNLSEILQVHGIELYAKLIKLLGPIPELIDKQFDCFEFNTL